MQQILPSLFNRRITIKIPNPVTDEAGGTSNDGYTELFSTWAHIEQLKTFNKVQYGLDGFDNAYSIIFRYASSRPALAINQLIDYNDGGTIKTLIIRSTQLQRESYKQFNVLVCAEYTNLG